MKLNFKHDTPQVHNLGIHLTPGVSEYDDETALRLLQASPALFERVEEGLPTPQTNTPSGPPKQDAPDGPGAAGDAPKGDEGKGGEEEDLTPGDITAVNADEAAALISEVKTTKGLDKLEADEKASQKHPDGRRSVLRAIAERREELSKQ